MEKEQKKLLLVAVSVGVFLLVTITVAMIILMPKAQSPGSSFSSSQPFQPGIIQPVENINVLPVQQPDIAETAPEEPSIIDTIDGDRLTIAIPRPTTAAVPDTPEVVVAPVRAPATTAPSAKPAQTAQPPARTAQPKQTASKPAPAKTINDYWVQTGAFSARVRAEDAKELLAEKGLTSIIENREINGSTWYRVRLGPYTSEREANYWLALVKSIDGFTDSQVRQTTRTQ